MEFLVEGFLALTWKHVVMYVIGIGSDLACD